MLVEIVCLVMAVAWLWPDTAVGQIVRRLLAEPLARRLPALTPGGVAFIFFLALVAAMALGLIKADGVALFAQGVPEGIGWFATFDIATYLDVIVIAWLLSKTVQLAAAFDGLRRAVRRALSQAQRVVALRRATGRTRARRSVRRPPKPPRDDDGPSPVSAFSPA